MRTDKNLLIMAAKPIVGRSLARLDALEDEEVPLVASLELHWVTPLGNVSHNEEHKGCRQLSNLRQLQRRLEAVIDSLHDSGGKGADHTLDLALQHRVQPFALHSRIMDKAGLSPFRGGHFDQQLCRLEAGSVGGAGDNGNDRVQEPAVVMVCLNHEDGACFARGPGRERDGDEDNITSVYGHNFFQLSS
jgi:hypothetical protein